MQAHPCQCILKLKLSMLRNEYKAICHILDKGGWSTLCTHLEPLAPLDSEDIGAISAAVQISHASPAQELILRMERKDNYAFTIQVLLHFSYTLGISGYIDMLGILNRIHDPKCRIYNRIKILSDMMSNEMLLTDKGNIPSITSYVEEKKFPSSQNINNLSGTGKPFLRITRQPVGVSIDCGESLILCCAAESDQPQINFNWCKDGTEIPDQREKVLMLSNAQVIDSGQYTCEVWCSLSLRETSNVAVVKVNYVADQFIYESPSTSSLNKESESLYVATDKFALLIANQNYEHNPTLASAMNDVEKLSSVLCNDLNFKTVSLVNLNLQEMNDAVRVFCRYLVKGAYCLTYLAGHGFENDGQCYIVPVDAQKNYTPADCFSVKNMIQTIQATCHLNLTVVLLDVCRQRNKNAVSLAKPAVASKKTGNIVISFATMESGMAYEVKGRKLGVYVSCLVNHLWKDKLITRVLELVHKDMHENLYTKGIQQPEFKSNIFEDRKLTDSVSSDFSEDKQERFSKLWRNAHVGGGSVLFVFESCNIKVKLQTTCIFSNVLLIEAKIVDKSSTNDCFVSISMKQEPQQLNKHTSCIRLEDLQKLQRSTVYLPIEVHLRWFDDVSVCSDWCKDTVEVPFITWWNNGF